jgi:hypothetical protein
VRCDHPWRTGYRAWWRCADCRSAEGCGRRPRRRTSLLQSGKQTLSVSKTKFDNNRDEGHRRPAPTRCNLLTDMGERPERHRTTHRSHAGLQLGQLQVDAHSQREKPTTNSTSSMQAWTNSQPMPRTALRVQLRKAAAVQPLLWYCLGGFAVTRISANPSYLVPLRFSCAAGLFRAVGRIFRHSNQSASTSLSDGLAGHSVPGAWPLGALVDQLASPLNCPPALRRMPRADLARPRLRGSWRQLSPAPAGFLCGSATQRATSNAARR